jgi:hypothetical protein
VARVSLGALSPSCGALPIANKFAPPALYRGSRALRLRRQVAAMVYVTRCTGLGPFTPGVVVPGRPAPAPPVAVLPTRPSAPAPAPPSAVPAQPVPAPVTPAPAPRRKHR